MNTGGPAFPRTGEGVGSKNYDVPGMTLRQFYKGMCADGELASQSTGTGEWSTGNAVDFAKRCGAFADALIAEDEEASHE